MKKLSKFNSEQNFGIEIKEGRLIKCYKLIDCIKIGKMLDVGCTNGDWGKIWVNKGWDVHGVDINIDNIKRARTKGIKAEFCDCNAQKLPFSDNEFDFIFAGEIIEHLVDTDSFIQDLYRCLKPKGKLIITTPNLTSFENRMRILLGIYPIWVDYSLEGSGHLRAYTPRVLKKQCEKHNLKLLKHKGNWVPFLPQKFVNDISMPWLSITGELFPSLSMDIIFLLEK